MIGQTISHFRIDALLGEGGMGVVYRAQDLTLQVPRALKFIKPGAVGGKQSEARLVREARAAALLNHSAICTVYEIGEVNGQPFIAMEYIDGQTLREIILAGSLDINTSLRIVCQIAEGLVEAHAKDIIHRDIKPANIMVTSQLKAKIMDFGLAKAIDGTQLTQPGTALGTSAYMSPEQWRGEELDARADLWSLGVVIYEMITGQLPFKGEHREALYYAVTHHKPAPVTSLCPEAPPELDWITRRALEKDKDRRYASAAEMLKDLRVLLRQTESGESAEVSTWILHGTLSKRRYQAALAIAVVAIAVVSWFAFIQEKDRQALPPSYPLQVTSSESLDNDPNLSPDGSRIVYTSNASGNTEIYVVDALGGRPVQLTSDPAPDYEPAWFPDGRQIAFVSERGGRAGIWKTGQMGGSATMLVPGGRQPCISADGTRMAFATQDSTRHLRIALVELANVTVVKVLTDVDDGGWDHEDPAWSPDGEWICYAGRNNLWLVPATGGDAHQLTYDGNVNGQPVWSPDGRYIYHSSFRGDSQAIWRILAEGGDPQRLTLGTGPESHPSVATAGQRLAYTTEAADEDLCFLDRRTANEHCLRGRQFDLMPSLARDGSKVVFISDRWGGRSQLWVQALVQGVPQGSPRRITEQAGNASHPALSHDGRWVAYYVIHEGQRDIWIVPVEGGLPVQVTNHPAIDTIPTWSPDDTRLAFSSDRGGKEAIWIIPIAAGQPSGPCEQLTDGQVEAVSPAWSPDGSQIAFVGCQNEHCEVWLVSADGLAPARSLTSGANAQQIRWSQTGDEMWVSGRWVNGQWEIRRVSPADGTAMPVVPPVSFAPATDFILFDLTADMNLLAFSRNEYRGNVWILETEEGHF